MIQTSRHVSTGMKRVVLGEILPRTFMTKSDLLKWIGLSLPQSPSQAQAQRSISIPEAKETSEIKSKAKSMSSLSPLFASFEKAGMKIDYKPLLNFFSIHGNVEDAIAVFRKIQEIETPTELTYHTLVVACVNGKDSKSAKKILKEMTKSGLKPEVETYNTVLSSFVEKGQINKAVKIFLQMKKANIKTYNLLMAICINGGQTEKAIEYWNEIEKVGLKPDVDSYNTFLRRDAGPQIIDLTGIIDARFFDSIKHPATRLS
eukprot:TRINITY_DN288_c0_g1_i1.p1 TRINITY_DN288_c0_g1~~TRINITY_DN288_c0_g1_i1.p1  ORF type:complete len:260 (-),score=34.19 TRINITY_DN288_c0_g1_i1:30-809(-)